MRPMLLLFVVLTSTACPPTGGRDGCDSDLDCGAQRCIEGGCFECASTADCGDGFCCQGVCRPADEVQERCGCAASPAGTSGNPCGEALDDALCLVDDAVATVANVGQGTCGCGCTPAQGGPICGAPDEAGGAPVCSCADNQDCAGASLDAQDRPHAVSNTCLPNATCSCVTAGGAVSPCEIDGDAPDCSFNGGCRALLADVFHCGVGNRSCLDATTGVVGTGQCFSGGCTCDNAADCQGDDLNVNTCAFPVVDEPSRCVCSGYTKAGVQIACPMELACTIDGCVYAGVPYGTEEELLAELSLAPPTNAAP